MRIVREPAQCAAVSGRLVYFIVRPSGRIKIGATGNPKARLRTSQTYSGEKLAMPVAIVAGNMAEIVERELHTIFNASRLEGEWFCVDECLGLVGFLAWLTEQDEAVYPKIKEKAKEFAIGKMTMDSQLLVLDRMKSSLLKDRDRLKVLLQAGDINSGHLDDLWLKYENVSETLTSVIDWLQGKCSE